VQLLQKIGKALNVNLSTAKLCVETNGSLVITGAGGVVLYDLSDGAGSNWVTSITKGVNGSFNTNYITGSASVNGDFADQFSFWDPIFVGSQTPFIDTNAPLAKVQAFDFVPGSAAFNVTGHAVGGFFEIDISYQTHTINSLTHTTVNGPMVYDNLEISDGSAATFACSLASGIYKQSFLINACGTYNSSTFGHGVLFGTASLSGTQTGGDTFLDPFNADNNFGNFDTFYNED
jgi:hypothetical protein